MEKITDLKEYKRKHDIPLPRSPYYTLNATETELKEAVERAERMMRFPFDYRGLPPYAVLLGYENIKTGKIKLLKSQTAYSDQYAFEHGSGINGHYVLALINEKVRPIRSDTDSRSF